jgi:hypothetical protein
MTMPTKTCENTELTCKPSIDICIDKQNDTTIIKHMTGKTPISITGWELKYDNKTIRLKGTLKYNEKMIIRTPFDNRTDLRPMKLTSPLMEAMIMFR